MVGKKLNNKRNILSKGSGLKPKFRKFTFENGIKYETIKVGSRTFKLKVAGKAELDEFIADGKLTPKQFYKKYPK